MTARPVLLLGDTLKLGGTEGQFVEIARGLPRSRWTPHVACVRAEGPLRERLDTAGIAPWSCGPSSFRSPSLLGTLLGVARYLRQHRIRLVHSFDFYSNIVGVLAARLTTRTIVIASQRDLGDLRTPFQQRIHRLMLRLADHVLVNTRAITDRLARELPRLTERLALVPNGVDLTRFSAVTQTPRSKARPLAIGTLANLRVEKGLHDFVRAAADVHARCPSTRFVIWGDGPLRDSLEDLVQQLGLAALFVLPGRTREPARALRRLDVFVLPSHSEACSNVLLEAMATQRAVIATRVGGNPELVEDEISGLLVPPGDPAALAKAILRLVEDPHLAQSLAHGAQQRVSSRFSKDAMLAAIDALYHRALHLETV